MSELAEPSVVACIPAFNEELGVGAIVVRVKRYVDDVLVCDDGSVDLTGEIGGRLGMWWLGSMGAGA